LALQADPMGQTSRAQKPKAPRSTQLPCYSLAKVDHIEKNNLYEDLRKNATQWAWDNTCERTATNFLKGLSLPVKSR
jgi:hypothetical protein